MYFGINDAYAHGGKGSEKLAEQVIRIIEDDPSGKLRFTYGDNDPIEEKIGSVAKKIYGAGSVTFGAAAEKKIRLAEKSGFGRFPVCIAKTQYSFSQDPSRYGAPSGFEFNIKDIVINAGAEMIVAIAGDIIRMPGLPKHPQALNIDIKDGIIEGLS